MTGLQWVEAGRALLWGPGTMGGFLLVCLAGLLWQHQRHRGERSRARRVQSELTAYMLLDDWKVQDTRAMGRRICRAVARHSPFSRTALLVRRPEGRLQLAASQRADELTVRALERWAEEEEVRERHRHEDSERHGVPARPAAELVRLERRSGYRAGDPAALGWCTALIVPMCNRRGHVTGALAVCADPFLGKPRSVLEDALGSLEVLAERFAESVGGSGAEREGGETSPVPGGGGAGAIAAVLPDAVQA